MCPYCEDVMKEEKPSVIESIGIVLLGLVLCIGAIHYGHATTDRLAMLTAREWASRHKLVTLNIQCFQDLDRDARSTCRLTTLAGDCLTLQCPADWFQEATGARGCSLVENLSTMEGSEQCLTLLSR